MVTRFLRRSTLFLLAALGLLLLSGGAAASPKVGQAQDGPTLTVKVSGPGRVTSSPAGIDCPSSTCSGSFDPDERVRLIADGAFFLHWSEACSGSSTVCDLTLGADTSVTATFGRGRPPPPPVPPPPPPPPPVDGDPPPPPPVDGEPPPPLPDFRDALVDEVDQELSKLRLANIAYNAPNSLHLGESAQIQLLLSAQKEVEELKTRLTELGERKGTTIKVSRRMEAHLAGTGFKIEPLTDEIQAVSSRLTTEWKWEVEPTKTGTQSLHLTLTALIDVSGEETAFSIKTFDTTIQIRVTWYDRVSDFFSHNWQWLWAVILAPLAAWLARNRKRWLWRLRPGPPPPPSS
jgi:hypothetical protein